MGWKDTYTVIYLQESLEEEASPEEEASMEEEASLEEEEDLPEEEEEDHHYQEFLDRNPLANSWETHQWCWTELGKILKCSPINGIYIGVSTMTIPCWQTHTAELCSSSLISKGHWSMNGS